MSAVPPSPRRSGPWAVLAIAVLAAGCKSPQEHREQADETAAAIIAEKQKEAFGRTEPFTIERPADTLRRRLIEQQALPRVGPESFGTDRLEHIEHWPEEDYPAADPDSPSPVAPWEGDGPLVLSLVDALQIGARNNREYQDNKEAVFLAALDLDVERNEFRTIFGGSVDGAVTADRTSPGAPEGVEAGADFDVSRALNNGAILFGSIGLDIVKLLTGSKASSLGVFGDASITIPLLRGAGRHVVTEPLTQAERNVVYALRSFDRFKRSYAVQVASGYLDVLRRLDSLANSEENYRVLVILRRRTNALDLAGRIEGLEVDQARQNELRARDRWIAARQDYESRLDSFKVTLGLPPDARIELDRDELGAMTKAVHALLERAREEQEEHAARRGDQDAASTTIPKADAPVELTPPTREGGGPFEIDERKLIRLAFLQRQDLQVARGRVYDAQRDVTVAADALRAGLDLDVGASFGEGRSLSSADSPDAKLRPDKGVYTADALLDLPLERTAERNAYRASYIALEQAVRDVQDLEDRIKTDVRDGLRSLLRARESLRIQGLAEELARVRVKSTNLFLEAGRAQVRDVLEATESLISAQNALTDALVNYRVTELQLERDLGVLTVDDKGLWTEYSPDRIDEELADAEP